MVKNLKIAIQCCECHRVKDGAVWHEEPHRDDVAYSHGYCPTCMRNALIRFGLESNMVNQALAMAQ